VSPVRVSLACNLSGRPLNPLSNPARSCRDAASRTAQGQRCERRTAIATSSASTPEPTTPAEMRPWVRRPRNAWSAWLESTDPVLWWDRADPELWYDSSEAADIADPIDPADANEPTLASDANDAALPIERIESWEQIERVEFSDQSDHTYRSVDAFRRSHVRRSHVRRRGFGTGPSSWARAP
jgi:hypothetical protein